MSAVCDCCRQSVDERDVDAGICGKCYQECSLTCSVQKQRDEDVQTVVEAARRQLFAQNRREIHQLATILANTRPNDDGTEGEWALRLHEAGVRPPRTRPKLSRP